MRLLKPRISRRGLLKATGVATASAALHRPVSGQTALPGDTLVREVSVADIRNGYQEQTFSIAEFVNASLNRIDALEGSDGYLGAMIEINPDALDIAEQMDQELRRGNSRGSMHGVPVVVKDVFATADRMQTTAGSRAMIGTQATRDAFIVERMREAGMVILGKANLTEWSGYRPVLYGWSARGGISVNPNVLTQTTWGSSSGSAAAVAASYAPVSIGVETDGSIICPASACGVVGIKPTMSLTSRQGAIANGYSLDSPGVMGRSVADAAALLTVIAGFDSEDPAFGPYADLFPAGTAHTDLVPPPGVRDYTKAIVEGGLQGARIGVVRAYWGPDAEANRHAENALVAMEEAGAVLIEDIYPLDAMYQRENPHIAGDTMGIEFPAIFSRFLRDYAPNGPVQSLDDVVQWYNDHPDESQWAFENDPLYGALWPAEEWGAEHLDAIRALTQPSRQDGIDAVMDQYELDALVAPTCAIATRWDNTSWFWASSELAANAGYPSITIPVGYTEDLPSGLHFFGRAFSERKLIRFAAELERTLQVRVAPQFLEYTRYDEWYAPVPWENADYEWYEEYNEDTDWGN